MRKETSFVLILNLIFVLSAGLLLKDYLNLDFSKQVSLEELTNDLSSSERKNISIQHYNINGTTAAALREQLNILGPFDHKGIRRDACVKWEISWRWPKTSNGKPNFQQTKSTYKIQVLLPSWIPAHGTPNDLVAKWNDFYQKITRHEAQHLKNALKYAELPAKAIQAASIKNPALTKREANMIGFEILDQLEKEDRLYDLNTDHGRKEDITFP